MFTAKHLLPNFSKKSYSALVYLNKISFSTYNNKYIRLLQMKHRQYAPVHRVRSEKNVISSVSDLRCYCTKHPEDEILHQNFKDDPELKELIQQFKSDFGHSATTENDTESDDSSEEDTDSDGNSQHQEHEKQDGLTDEEKRLHYYKVQEQIVEAELQEMYTEGNEYAYEYETEVKAPPVSLERGRTGVFDIGEIVDLLRSENAIDLCVLEIPPDLFYVNHMVLATGTSYRHRLAMAEYIKKLFKKKRASGDQPSVRIEGRESKDWLALDLGNIAVHLFEASTREHYDLESLWSVGPEHDDLVQLREQVTDPWAALLSERGFLSAMETKSEEMGLNDKSTKVGVSKDMNMKSMESSKWHKIQEEEPS